MTSPATTTTGPRPSLTVLDAVSIVLGIVIGAGIYQSPSVVAANTGSAGQMLLIWVAGGVLSLLGALCFAELATAYPHAGGNYEYLRRAFGADTAFLFAWGRMTVIQTGSMALLGFVFGDYASQILSLGRYSSAIYALAAILVFTAINLIGLRLSKNAQNVMTVVEVLGIAVLIIAGLVLSPPAPAAPVAAPATGGSLGLMMIFVLLAFGGWSEAAFVSAEVKSRNGITIALFASITVITTLYLLANLAMLRGLGLAGMAASSAVSADLMRVVAGENGARFISVLVTISAVSSLNVTVLTGARSIYAVGEDFGVLRFLGGWESKANAPRNALLVQAVIAVLLVGLGTVAMAAQGTTPRAGFETMVAFTAPVFWFFFLLTGISLMVLRHREPDVPRPFRVPFYPIIPLVFCATGAYLVYATLAYAGMGSLAGAAVLAAGVPVLMVARRKRVSAPATALPRRVV
ncbi:MAG: APC family permease [Candidatus Korobacteraceae bacterium]